MAERLVFLDTGGIYAWINKMDPWYETMCALPKAEGCRLVVTDYIVDEACSLHLAQDALIDARRSLRGRFPTSAAVFSS